MGVEIQVAFIGILISVWGAFIAHELKQVNENLKKLIEKREGE